ncbi:MAG: glycoside hydrolase family 5 protein [Balneolaceae bacterium]
MQKIRLLPTILLILLFSSFTCPATAQNIDHPLPLISVEGNRFVDENGDVYNFRGVSSSDPDRLEKAGHWNKEYFEAVKSFNANVIRFPVHPRAWRERGHEEYLNLLDDGIKWAGELGMYVIIDWHSIGNLRTEVYQSNMYSTTKTETFRFWRTIAARYKENTVVAFYETFNEPTTYNGELGELTWLQLKELHEEIIFIIYAHDKTVIPLIGGLNWAYDLTPVIDDPVDYPGVAYVTHPYPQKRDQPWDEKWQDDWGFVADTYPIVATELGFMSEDGRGAHVPVIGDETYGNAIINFFEERGISWVAWVFDPQWSPQLIESWNFEPTRQGHFFKEKMGELNE